MTLSKSIIISIIPETARLLATLILPNQPVRLSSLRRMHLQRPRIPNVFGYKLKQCLFLCCIFSVSWASHAQPINRVEPLFWWTNMVNPQLQLMVYGPDISLNKVSIDYPGVTLLKTELVDNPNYMFITLTIAKEAQAGQLDLRFSPFSGKQSFVFPYELKAREAGSAQRQGFNLSDAIYLVVPDRFVNGDSSNDASNDTLEKPQRKEPGGRHGGDIQGLSQALPYIADMGFTQIWSTPLTENNSKTYSYHGYAATDLYRIDPRFGSNESYRAFVLQAKQQGVGVIKDIVLNHIGIDHWWMQDLPTTNWINNKAQFTQTSHARTTVQDPYASKHDKVAFDSGWFVPSMPDLNQKQPLLATYLIQNSIWWIEYAGLSGIREDTYSYADKTFLQQWAQQILNEYPHFNMVGEEWSANPLVVSYWQKGKHNTDGYTGSMPSMMDFPNYYALLNALNNEESWDAGWIKLYESLANDGIYPNPSNLVLFEGNHDTARLFSLLNDDPKKFAKAVVLLSTLPRIPQFFYGTEIVLQSPKERNDGLVRADFPGGWPNDQVDAFTGQGLSQTQKEAQTLVKTLLNYRQHNSVLQQANMMHFSPYDGIYSYVRGSQQNNGAQVWVFLSKNAQAVQLEALRYQEENPQNCVFRDILSKQRYQQLEQITLPANGWLVLECEAVQ